MDLDTLETVEAEPLYLKTGTEFFTVVLDLFPSGVHLPLPLTQFYKDSLHL